MCCRTKWQLNHERCSTGGKALKQIEGICCHIKHLSSLPQLLRQASDKLAWTFKYGVTQRQLSASGLANKFRASDRADHSCCYHLTTALPLNWKINSGLLAGPLAVTVVTECKIFLILCCRNGGWTPWSSWGQCSTTCEIGFEVRQRSCNNPAPRHGGRVCVGQAREQR